jgi:hypothetical protein
MVRGMKLPDISPSQWVRGVMQWVRSGSAKSADSEAQTTPAPAILTEERRRHERARKSFTAVLSLERGGLPVEGIDLHDFGAAVVSQILIPPDSVIFIHVRQDHRVGFAHVRHCTLRGKGTYVIGLEFRGGLMAEETGGWRYQRVPLEG